MRKSSAFQRDSVQTPTKNARSRRIKPKAITLAVATCFSANLALANPSNPTVVSGTASFAQAGNILNITNSHNAIINWGSFSIGVNELTRFIQPSALSAVLNRVIGQDPSAILGALQSNGRVFLINPNGIVFGAGAQINVAGLVASTLNLSNDDFLNNRMKFTDGAGAGSVVNQGSITGGSVYLVGNAVTNNGLITSPNGEVVLAAGNSVELVNPGTPNLRVEVVAPENEARNLGTITAEAGRIGIYAGLIKQSGVISADSAIAEGGRVLLKSTKKTTLDAGSMTSARGTSGGEILVFSDMSEGLTEVAGTLDASATIGNGGFVETSAARVKVADGAIVKTMGGASGSAGKWLIDPFDFVISAYGGDISGTTLSANLATTPVDIMSAYGGTTSADAYGGDLFVSDAISWSSGNALSLYASRNINVNNSITNTGTGSVNMYAGGDGYNTSTAVTSGVGDININANVSSGGALYFKAGNNINVNGATLTSGGLTSQAAAVTLDAYGGSITLANGAVINALGGNSGSFSGYGANVYLYAYNGTITADGASVMSSGGSGSASYGGGIGAIDIDANTVDIKNGSLIRARGGNGAMDGSSSGYDADVYIYARGANGVKIANSTVEAIGGFGLSGGQQGDAYLNVQTGISGGNVDINNSVVSANGFYSDVYFTSSSGGSIMVANSTVTAQGRLGADGGEGYVNFYAPGGTINTASSAVSALGQAGNWNQIYFNANSDVTLGLLAATDSVYVYSGGSITDGNAGLNISAPYVYMSGYNGVGSVANPIETQISNSLSVYSSTGGAGIINIGDLNLGSLDTAGAAAIGSTGSLIVDGSEGVYSGGDLALFANSNLNILTNVNASGNLLLNAGGNLLIGGPDSYYSTVYVVGETSTTAVAGGSLSVLSAGSTSMLGSFSGPTTIKTGGNVTVDNSAIVGNPDIMMTVGGVINMNNGGIIVAAMPSTIYLTFPMLTSGGYFVNGVEGVVFDPLTSTGFCAQSCPAILGTNLLVTYGGGVSLDIPTDALIVAMGESSKPPDPEKDKDVFEDIKDAKKKEAPVCR